MTIPCSTSFNTAASKAPTPGQLLSHITLAAVTLLSLSFTAIAQEELEGPGLFSGEKGEFSLSKIINHKEAIQSEQESGQRANTVLTPGKTLTQQEEFASFKAWKQAKETNSPTYQEFLLWLAFEDFKSSNSNK